MTISPPPSFEDNPESSSESEPPQIVQPSIQPTVQLSKPRLPEPEFPDLVQDIFPSGGMHVLGGSRGAGKTAFEVWMSRHILRGEPFMGHETHAPVWWGVLILDRDTSDRLQWWDAAGMDPLPYYSLTSDKSITPQKLLRQEPTETIRMVEQAIDNLKPPRGGVITIDVANFVAGDANLSYRSGFAHGWALSRIAADRGITIFALMHGGKQKSGQQYFRLTDRIIASTGFLGTANTIAYVATPQECEEDEGLQAFEWEPHHHKPERFLLQRTSEGLYTVQEGLTLPERQPKEPDAAMMTLLDAIPFEEWLPGALIRENMRVPKATFSRRIKSLREFGLVDEMRQGKHFFYRRKAADPTPES